jgi:hypothetical protein
MPTTEVPRFIAITPVKADRQTDFESFVSNVVVPAVRTARPELDGLWSVLRPVGTMTDGVAAYAFLFHGEPGLDDWELSTLLTEAYGDVDGPRRLAELEELLAAEQEVHEFSGLLPR